MTAGGIIAVAPLSLTDRLTTVRDLLVARGVIAIERVFLGTQYEELEGDGLQLTFTPTGMAPSTAPLEMSSKEGGHNLWECDAHMWAVDAGDDYGFGQFRALEDLIVELQGALRIVAGGRVKMSNVQIATDTRVLKYGEKASFSFSFQTAFQMVPDTEPVLAGPTTTNAIPRAIT